MGFIKKTKKFFFFFCVLIFVLFILSIGKNYQPDELVYGATFSQKHSQWLVGEKWRDNYLQVLDDLQVRRLRIPAYWDVIQKNDSEHFDFSNFDWMIKEAEKRDAKIILAVGYRLPRWPECHLPTWAKSLDQKNQEEKVLSYIKNTIQKYKDSPAIMAWQIENEPFLRLFGECPTFNQDFLDQEISLVKELDSRPVVVTDSGELSLWIPAAKRADIFGTSMYLNTYSKNLKSYVHYPIGPRFFHFKKNLAGLFAKPKKWIVIEMQAEPWGPVSYTELSEKDKGRSMDLEKFRAMMAFGQKTGFREFYLWGAEWWYWEKEIKNNPAYWQEAKNLFAK